MRFIDYTTEIHGCQLERWKSIKTWSNERLVIYLWDFQGGNAQRKRKYTLAKEQESYEPDSHRETETHLNEIPDKNECH